MKTWIVIFGECRNVYYSEYHAEQMATALRMNDTPYRIEIWNA